MLLEYSFLLRHSCQLWKIILQIVNENKPFCYFQHLDKRKKSVVGHESNKLIELQSAQPTKVRVIFNYQAIYNFNSSKIQSAQPFLTNGPHYIFYLFFLTFSASTIHKNKSRLCQQPTNVNVVQSIEGSNSFSSKAAEDTFKMFRYSFSEAIPIFLKRV